MQGLYCRDLQMYTVRYHCFKLLLSCFYSASLTTEQHSIPVR